MKRQPRSMKSAPADAVSEANEVILEGDESNKVGRRNSAGDQKKLQDMHDSCVSLGAECGSMAKSTHKTLAELAGSDSTKAIDVPLDVLVQEVRDVFFDIREKMRMAAKPFDKERYDYWEWDDDACPTCVAVYADHAVARIGLAHYTVPFVVENEGILLAPQGEWVQVTQEWVTKTIPGAFLASVAKREVGAVKSLPGGRLGNYLVLWGDSDNTDLTGEWFTKNTEGLTTIFETIGKVPALYQHAMDGDVKFTPVGVIDTMVADEVGLWTETQLDLGNKYAEAVRQLARRKALGSSSGTLPGARKVNPSGEIKAWPIIEGSFTPTPAEPRLRSLGVAEVKSIYQELGLELPEEIKSVDGTGDEESRQNAAEVDAEIERLRLLELSIIE